MVFVNLANVRCCPQTGAAGRALPPLLQPRLGHPSEWLCAPVKLGHEHIMVVNCKERGESLRWPSGSERLKRKRRKGNPLPSQHSTRVRCWNIVRYCVIKHRPFAFVLSVRAFTAIFFFHARQDGGAIFIHPTGTITFNAFATFTENRCFDVSTWPLGDVCDIVFRALHMMTYATTGGLPNVSVGFPLEKLYTAQQLTLEQSYGRGATFRLQSV